MNHPSKRILQEYFENELDIQDAKRVRSHLLQCDECSLLLQNLANVDVHFQNTAKIEVSKSTKENIFQDARSLLQTRKEQLLQIELKKEKRKRVMLKTSNAFWQMHRSIIDEIKWPAIHACSLLIIITTIIQINRYEKIKIDKKVIEDKVLTYTSVE